MESPRLDPIPPAPGPPLPRRREGAGRFPSGSLLVTGALRRILGLDTDSMGRLKRAGLALLAIAVVSCSASWASREWKAAALLEAGKEAAARGDLAAAGRAFAGVLARWPG